MKRKMLAILVLSNIFPRLLCGAEMDFQRAVEEAIKVGDLPKAKELCSRWAEKKPTDERPHLALGRIYVKQKLIDEAIEEFEIARELNPLNPGPACEMGQLFLMAGMGTEAVAEFRAALEVRKDYPPAVKGLAEAEALMADPYAKGTHIKLGVSNEERGVRQKLQEQTRVATIGGRQCRATNRAKGQHFLMFDVADEYLFDVDTPVRVVIEYYDEGRGSFAIRYDSTDSSAHRHGAWKDAPAARRTNSRTWKTVVLNLPDARFANRLWARTDFAICSEAWYGREDVYISSVRVTRWGLAVGVEPKIAVADGSSACTVTARVVDAAGPVGDGTVVRFTTDRGEIAREVTTVAGAARAVLKPGREPGEATIAVQTAEDRRVVHVPIVPGRGPAVRRRVLLDSFEHGEAWRLEPGKHQVTAERGPEGRDGRPSTRITYQFSRRSSSAITFRRPIALPGRPAKLGLWLKGDASHSRLHAVFVDATGQYLVYRVGVLLSEGWQWMEHDIGSVTYFRDGAADGRMHLPVRLDGLELGRYYDPPGKVSGEICVQDLTLVTDVPKSAMATAHLDVNAVDPNCRFSLPDPPVFQVTLTNLGDEAEQGGVRWKATDEMGKAVDEGRIDTVDIPPGSSVTTDVAIRVAGPGVYQASFTLDGGNEASTKTVTFVALRFPPRNSPTGQIRRDGRNIAFRLTNRTDAATRFSLSYRLLNAKREVVRKETLDAAGVAIAPGEELEIPVSIEGLAPGRYSAVLLFDMGDGKVFTRLLSFDAYSETVTAVVKVLADGDRPVAEASVRARLFHFPHQRLQSRGRTLQEWEVQTDEAGLFKLSELRVPDDIPLCRVYVDIVATGLVDRHHNFRADQFMSFDARPRPAPTLHMTRGVQFSGRVVGSDEMPVPDASVYAMGILKEKNRPSKVQFHRARKTGPDGRFELEAAANAAMELTVHAPPWAPKRVLIPAGQLDAGDLSLERGATVSGTLVDADGEPASGYWVVAEGTARVPSPVRVSPVVVAAKTGPDGAFTLPTLKGEYVVSTPASFQLWNIQTRRHSPSPRLAILPRTLTLDRDPVELKLRGVRQARIAGRVLDVNGAPQKEIGVSLHCLGLGRRFMSDEARTDDGGRFAFEGIPIGLKGVMISVPALRPWKQAKRIYLRARPLDHVAGRDGRGHVLLNQIKTDLLNVDFQFQYWSPKDGFLGTSATAALTRGAASRSVLDGLGSAFQDIVKRLTQGTPLAGRVLDEAGKGVQGARVRVLLVRSPVDGQPAEGKAIGPWQAVAGADGRYTCAAVSTPADAAQYIVRIEVIATGYVKKRQDFPLPPLLTSGARRLRVPDLSLELAKKQ